MGKKTVSLCKLTLSIPGGGGHYGPPYVIFFDNFLLEVFFDPNSSQVFLKTPKTCFKRNLKLKIFFTGRVIRVFSLRGLNYEILFLDFFQFFY